MKLFQLSAQVLGHFRDICFEDVIHMKHVTCNIYIYIIVNYKIISDYQERNDARDSF